MIELVIASQIANDKMRQQFADPPRRPARTPAPVAVAERRAPLRRATVRVLRVLADRIEPSPRYVRA
jgi:hypothetical protein